MIIMYTDKTNDIKVNLKAWAVYLKLITNQYYLDI